VLPSVVGTDESQRVALFRGRVADLLTSLRALVACPGGIMPDLMPAS